MTTFKTSN